MLLPLYGICRQKNGSMDLAKRHTERLLEVQKYNSIEQQERLQCLSEVYILQLKVAYRERDIIRFQLRIFSFREQKRWR